MKVAYLIFAYKNPQLLRRLIEVLSSDNCSFFIHIDSKSNIGDFSLIQGNNIFFSSKRIPVYWAEFSGVVAILALIRQAFSGPQVYDYFVLLSGSEYPLKNKQYIHNYLESHRGMEFMNLVKMPNREAGKPISRINTLRVQSDRPVLRFIVKVLARLGLGQRDYRKYLGALEPYSGNTWWALTRDACQYILDFLDRNQNVVEYFKNTFAPEEMVFHTILGNSEFRTRIRRNLTYEDWSGGGGHPAMIGERHIAFFGAHDKLNMDDVYGSGELLFARKFSDDNLELVQRMDELIKRKDEENH